MKIYHGTSLNIANRILLEGIKPREDKGNWHFPGQVRSMPDMVYFGTLDMVQYHAFRKAIIEKENHWAIIEVELDDLDKNNLYPDENLFVEFDEDGLVFAAGMVRAKKQVLENQSRALECLEVHNMICHKGVVWPEVCRLHSQGFLQESLWSFLADETGTIEELHAKTHCYLVGMANGYIRNTASTHIVGYGNETMKIYEADRFLFEKNYPAY